MRSIYVPNLSEIDQCAAELLTINDRLPADEKNMRYINLKPTGTSDWHQWNSGTSGMTGASWLAPATGTRKLVSVYGP